METKSAKSSNVLLFGLSFNLIMTLGSLGFTRYSLNRLDSRLTSVEQDFPFVNSYRLDNREIVKPTSSPSRARGSQMMKTVAKRAVNSRSMCNKCSRVCLNWNGHHNVSYQYSLSFVVTSVFQILNILKILKGLFVMPNAVQS